MHIASLQPCFRIKVPFCVVVVSQASGLTDFLVVIGTRATAYFEPWLALVNVHLWSHGVFHKEYASLSQNYKQYIFLNMKYLSSSTEQCAIYAITDVSPQSDETSSVADVSL